MKKIKMKENEIELIRKFPLSTLISSYEDKVTLTKAPLLLKKVDEQYFLEGHIAKFNPHLDVLYKQPQITALFDGPNSYISPLWYEDTVNNVPTWNFTSLQAYGTVEIAEDGSEETLNSVIELSQHFENSTVWIDQVNRDYMDSLSKAILAIRIHVESVHSTFKLSQEKSIKNQKNIIKELENKDVSKEMSHFLKLK